MSRPIKTHTFKGKRYKVEFLDGKRLKVGGTIDPPDEKHKTIQFRKKYSSEKNELEAYVHESLHACFPDVSEETITRSAEDITKILRRLGYKKNVSI